MAVPAPRDPHRTSLVHGPDSPLVGLAKLCARVARSDATVLITGETGTGKEVFARLVHEHSARVGRPLVPVNCAAIPETLLESELFGYVKGAFTGAFQSRKGRIALAEGGTLFLDEIGELPLPLQAKLLRVLQERSYEPVGSTEPIPADFRLVVATNRDLAAEVEAGRFRRDLFYRLLVCPMDLPPLRERRGDIAPLFLHFWRKRGETRPIAPAALAQMAGHDWPGNVRELENLVERLSICVEADSIGVADLPPEIRRAPAALHALAAVDPVDVQPAEPPVQEIRATAAEVPARHDVAGRWNDAGPGGVRPMEPAPLFAAGAGAHGVRPVEPAPALAPDDGTSPRYDEASSVAPGAASNLDRETTEAEELRRMCSGLADLAPPSEGAEALERAGHALPLDLPQLLRSIEDRFIEEALGRTGGNKKAAADLLGLQRTTLVEKLRRRGRDSASP